MATYKKDELELINGKKQVASQNTVLQNANGGSNGQQSLDQNTANSGVSAINQPSTASSNGYTSSGAVEKAQGNGFSYNSFNKSEYTPSDTVQQAGAALQAIQAAQPGAYQSNWQNQVNDIIGRIMNREKFSYDINDDELYQQYRAQYIRDGQLAMQDTMGQAAALTGGYGSSYASTAGNQAYQGYLSKLNDIVPELYAQALDRYQMEGEEMYNQYSMLNAQDSQDYSRYKDSYNQWLNERGYATDRYDSEKSFDYSQYTDDRNFDYGAYADDKQYAYNDYRNAIDDAKWKESQEYQQYMDAIGIEQWDKSFAEEQRQYDTSFAETQKQNAIGNEQWEKSFGETVRQNDIGNEQWDKSFSYQQDRDSVADSQWDKSFGYQQDRDAVSDSQWDKSFEYQQDRDAVSDSQWDKSFGYQQDRDAVSDSQWDKSFAETQKQNTIGNQQWEQNFSETQKQNNIDNEYRENVRQDSKDSENRAYAREDVLAVLKNGGTPSGDQLRKAGWTKSTAQAYAALSSGDSEAALEHVASMSYGDIIDMVEGFVDEENMFAAEGAIEDAYLTGRIDETEMLKLKDQYLKTEVTDTTVNTKPNLSGGGGGKITQRAW